MTTQLSDHDAMAVLNPENDIRRDVAIRLTVLARLMRNDFDRYINDINITRSQWSLIVVVSRHPGATQRFIAEVLEMSEASAGRLIDRLCAEGLLERRARDDDRRARAVYLTDAAKPLLQKLGAIALSSETRLFAGLEDDDLEKLLGYLDRIYGNLATRG